MRRFLCLVLLLCWLGASMSAMSAISASADDSCDGTFTQLLDCWTRGLKGHTVAVDLDRKLAFNGDPADRAAVAATVLRNRHNLEVRVLAGTTTDQGGTALLVLAGHRLVHPGAHVTRLTQDQVTELRNAGACSPRPGDLCAVVGPKSGAPDYLSGRDLIGFEGIAALPRTEYSLAARGDPGPGLKDWLLIGMSALLALLLAGLVLAVRRSSAPQTVLATPGTARRAADEPTVRVRAAAARPHGRRTTARPTGPTSSAVVRTELHPQGYVELGRVLYRARWADPGRPPPGPGSRVDVTEAPDPDSGLLHAFPPAPARGNHTH
ncbi:hypothetical protein DI272_28870 [Streptomyces sp. Act143]|uniref:hypothetical protein n=1 Tax=Streptomyces sp. Act143 TaxID=2200760 RepID=UPI000D680B12|nr:hypothetical protein [Streptomyces sp. Act143]PWI17725.1 hypothetical protein DI272_28870 [Streptomyces sp. Act143]